MKHFGTTMIIALAILLLASNAFASIAFIPAERQANISRNDTIGLQYQLKNTGSQQACIDLGTEQNDAYIDTSLADSHLCLNEGESTNVTLTIRTINAPRGLNSVHLNATSSQGNATATANILVSEEPEIELVTYASDICRGSRGGISVLVRNNSDEFKQVTLQAENEMLLPYFERQEIGLMPFQERRVDLVVSTSPYSMLGRHNVSLYAITSDETVKESISLDVEDCREENAAFSVSISGSCFTIEKGKDEKIYFRVKNLLGTEQKVFFGTEGNIAANLQAQSAWLEGNEQRQFYFTVNAGNESGGTDYNVALRVWNAGHSVEKSVCINLKKGHGTVAEVKENGLLVEQCESVVFTVLLKNTGDYYEDFKLSIDNGYGKAKAVLSDTSVRLEKHTERQVYVSVTALEGLPEGSYNITLNAKTGQGTIKKTLNFKVIPKQEGPVPQPEELKITSYPAGISMDANSQKTIFAMLKNGSGETMDGISLELFGLPAGATAQAERNIRLLPGEERRFELAITAGKESIGQHSIVLSAYNGTYSDEKQITLSIQEAEQPAAGTIGGLIGLFVAGGEALLGLAVLALVIVAIVALAGALGPAPRKEIWMRW